MRKRWILTATVASAATVAAFGLAGPAAAGPTTVDVSVGAGSLTIAAQPESATLGGAQFNAALPSQATGSFGNVTVSDGRGLGAGWTLSAQSTNFTGLTDNTKSISLSAANPLVMGAVLNPTIGPNVTSATCLVNGTTLVAANTPLAMATGLNLLTGLDPATCTFNSEVTLNVPANTPAQTYRGVVTLTVA
jgi:hypothetical protein